MLHRMTLSGAELEVQEVGDTTWLAHEVELLARKTTTPESREIGGNDVLFAEETEEYFWVADGNKAVRIAGSSTEVPLTESFVAAYLAVLPSDLDDVEFDDAHEQQFIRDYRSSFPGAGLDGFSSQAQLTVRVKDLKDWWTAHRNDPVLLPTPTVPPESTPLPGSP